MSLFRESFGSRIHDRIGVESDSDSTWCGTIGRDLRQKAESDQRARSRLTQQWQEPGAAEHGAHRRNGQGGAQTELLAQLAAQQCADWQGSPREQADRGIDS